MSLSKLKTSVSLLLALLLVLPGCGSAMQSTPGDYAPAQVLALAQAENQPQRAAAPADRFAQNTAQHPRTPDGPVRRIIYNGRVELVVEDFSDLPDRVAALLKQYDAYLADSNLSGASGSNRRATWKVRVPVARFDEFMAAVKTLGETSNVQISSQDVSEEYYDVDARIRNKTKEEARLIQLLEERPGKLEDVIAIERELSRVREELERMQGRMRMLESLTSLATVDITVQEVHGYTPPEAPGLATRMRRAFEGSLFNLFGFGEELLIGLVALVPWLPLLAVPPVAVYYLIRKLKVRLRRGTI